jgi:hypothetical protein
MKMYFKLSVVLLALYLLPCAGMAQAAGSTQYKCMIQMTNYSGDGAYIVVSLIDSQRQLRKDVACDGH